MDFPFLIKTQDLTMRFGGLVAVNKVTLTISEGEILGIIGPNGAGKTTLINLITGYYYPSEGKIYYRNEDITNTPSRVRARKGLVRTFQLVSVFNALTVLDNMLISIANKENVRGGKATFYLKGAHGLKDLREKSLEVLSIFGLDSVCNKRVAELPYGAKRKLELAMALVLNPVVLFIDEFFAGLSEAEIDEMVDVLRNVSRNRTLIIVEHKISWIMKLVKRLVVMNEGSVIADGEPEKVLYDPKVQEIYWKIQKSTGGE
ncbi:MAG: ABC transporter ATP-binding protein [Candidatus Nezhaarchaeales archaeon]